MIKKDDFRAYARGDPIKVESLEVHNPINLVERTPMASPYNSPCPRPNTPATPAVPNEHERIFSNVEKIADTGEKCPGR